MESWIMESMNQFGYGGIFLLIAIENLFPPIPSEIILTFGGFLTTCTVMTPLGVVLAATAGSVVGAMALYGVGRVFSPARLESWLSGRVGRLLHFRKGEIDKAGEWFTRKGKSTVFFCRCIPIVRSLISIPAGMAKMRLLPFLLMTTAGSFLWNILLVLLGVFAGTSWEKIAGYFHLFSSGTLVVLALAGILAVLFFFRRKAS